MKEHTMELYEGFAGQTIFPILDGSAHIERFVSFPEGAKLDEDTGRMDMAQAIDVSVSAQYWETCQREIDRIAK